MFADYVKHLAVKLPEWRDRFSRRVRLRASRIEFNAFPYEFQKAADTHAAESVLRKALEALLHQFDLSLFVCFLILFSH